MDELLPLIPHGASEITDKLSVICENEKWIYMHCGLPIYAHQVSDKISFKLISSSLILTGICRNIDIQKVFNVSKSSVLRNCKRYEAEGSAAFFKSKAAAKRNGQVLSAEKIESAGELLSAGFTRSEVAAKLGIKYATLSKAVQQGRIKFKAPSCTDKSGRSLIDSLAGDGIGVACTRTSERALAAFGLLNAAESRFESCNDVSNGGVLTSLPSLMANGLYHKVDECFKEFDGYYSVTHIMTLLAFMALSRIKTVEKLRWQPPGELGKLLGLDRIPEVRCLREKISALSADGVSEKWGDLLTEKWLNDYPDLSGTLYIDGHVRLYAGKEKLPKQYVSRERLCLRGVMDFWVNDMLGQPFFVVRTTVNPGMLEVLKNDIVPHLLGEVPNQPTEQMLSADPCLHRFIIVFDREGYSPAFFRAMWDQHRIACMTYHKYPDDDWEESEFKNVSVDLVNGETAEMKLAERGSYIGCGKEKIWIKEVRKLTKSGHQTSIVSSAYSLANTVIAVLMFARWCQENFFNYMMQHFAIDLLSEYSKEAVPDTEKVISSKWRTLTKEINSMNGRIKSCKSRFAGLTLNPAMENNKKNYDEWIKTKSGLAEEINILENKLKTLKNEQKNTDKHIKVIDLPEDEIFQRLASSKKHLVDTVKMIAYRAETAMANLIAKECGSLEQARALIRDVFTSEADLIPDDENKILNVRLHNLSTKAMDKKLDSLLSCLNDAEMKYPGTNLTLRYTRIGN